MTTAPITYRDVQMDVTGDYHPEGRAMRWEQADPAEFIAEEVWIGDQDVTALVRSAGWMAGVEAAALSWCERNQGAVARQAVEAFEPVEVE